MQPNLIAPLPPGTDFVRSTFRYRRYGRDPASLWHDGRLHRVLRSGLAVRVDESGVWAWAEPAAADLAELAHLLGARFDLDGLRAAHPEVYALAPGYRPILLADPFEALATTVTAQQISLRAACAMRARLVERFGRPVSNDGATWFAFPAQTDLAGADLDGLGLSAAKRGRCSHWPAPTSTSRASTTSASAGGCSSCRASGRGPSTGSWPAVSAARTPSRPATWASARPSRGSPAASRSGPPTGSPTSAAGSGRTRTWPSTTC